MDWYSIKAALRKHWKWLAVSALVVASITASCGQSVLSTSPVCISINMAIRGLLLPIATPQPAQKNNSMMDTTSIKIINSDLLTSQNSSERLGAQQMSKNATRKRGGSKAIVQKQFATSIVANTATLVDRTITSASLITRLMIFNSLTTKRDCILTRVRHWKNSGLMASPRVRSLTTAMRLTLPATYLKKSPGNALAIITCDATNTAWPTGLNPNSYVCLPATKNLLAG